MRALLLSALVFSVPAAAAIVDLRATVVAHALQGDAAATLQEVRRVLLEHPVRARLLGLELLEGELLIELDDPLAAADSLIASLSGPAALRPYARLRLAEIQGRLGHPEVAAGLVATLLGSGPPRSLQSPAVDLLRRSLERGGDCRLLRGLDRRRLTTSARRSLDLATADCALRGDDSTQTRVLLGALLEEATSDDVAREVAHRLAQLEELSPRERLLVGRALHEQRDFELAIAWLRPLAEAPSDELTPRQQVEATHLLARSYFWLEELGEAALWFERLAGRSRSNEERSGALFQRARCLELAGLWDAAADGFRLAYAEEQHSQWAASSLLSALRIEWRSGHEAAALELYELLRSRRSWATTAASASIFLASSELVRGRSEHAASWLNQIPSGLREAERSYWGGRSQELRGDPAGAVASYLDVLLEDSGHPLADAAGRRLQRQELATAAQSLAETLSRSTRREPLLRAVLLLDPLSPGGGEARRRLGEILARDPRVAELLDPQPVATSEWPLWQASLRGGEEQLLALGLWRNISPALVLRHFPSRQPRLALTAAVALGRAGAYRQSLYVTESLLNRLRGALPKTMQPTLLRETLYPIPFRPTVVREAQRHGADPHLLLAIMREESRFEPTALSGAAARGLTQFVLPTAERVGRLVGLSSIAPDQLYEPRISIALGAAYLGQLTSDLRGRREAVVAAYNAGEPQARLWLSHCYSREPEEFLAKVSFKETRGYLRRVLRSWQEYRELYPELTDEARPRAQPG